MRASFSSPVDGGGYHCHMTQPVQVTTSGTVTVIRLDDGKANAISHDAIAGIHGGLTQAAAAGGAVALIGRPGRFSAGFDLNVMGESPDAARELVAAGAGLLVSMLQSPRPIVAGCTGHALAMGALLLLASDRRIGAAGDFKIGLNEVAIGMPLPRFAVRLARDRLPKQHVVEATMLAEIYAPDSAVDVGYLDGLVADDEVEAAAVAEAERLAALPGIAFAATKRDLRGPPAAEIAAGLASEQHEWGFGAAR
jgi:enoyl-CoA hydratase